jgi:hypothetical protein
MTLATRKDYGMVYIPAGAEWYVAEIIEEISVEGDDRNVVHKNLVLIHADSPDAAYSRALQIGSDGNTSYRNPDDKNVISRFRGLGYLDVVHGGIEDGTELLYERKTSVAEEEILKWVKAKEQLPLFGESENEPAYPNYSSGGILSEAVELIERKAGSSS